MSSDPADQVLELARSRPPTLGAGRLICIDGPAGSGKTSLAAAISTRSSAPVVHVDDLYNGWTGLPTVAEHLGTLLRPLAAGRPGSYRRYDWDAGSYAETVTVDPTPLLVVEGVGAGDRAHADLCTVLVVVTAPDDVRLARGMARDGEELRAPWVTWMAAERVHLASEATLARADLVIETAGPSLG